jgi:hypothetical protein
LARMWTTPGCGPRPRGTRWPPVHTAVRSSARPAQRILGRAMRRSPFLQQPYQSKLTGRRSILDVVHHQRGDRVPVLDVLAYAPQYARTPSGTYGSTTGTQEGQALPAGSSELRSCPSARA